MLDEDEDYNPYHSEIKKGGYTWGGGYIDPAVKLPGYKEHPTLGFEESIVRGMKFRKGAQDWGVQKNLFHLQEGSNF